MTGLPTPCQGSSTSNTVTCNPDTAGTYNISVGVTDSVGNTTTATGTLIVNAALGITLSITPSQIVLGKPVTMTATTSGGTNPFSFSWTGLPDGCLSANQNIITCTPTAAGNFTVTVTVIDATSTSASVSGGLTILTQLSANLSIVPSTTIVGQSVKFDVTATGGVPPYTYSWN